MEKDNNFQAKLSVFLTNQLVEQNAAPSTDDQPQILHHFSDENAFGDEVAVSTTGRQSKTPVQSPTDVPVTADALAGHVDAQRAAGDRLRRALLQPLQDFELGPDKTPSLAARTRCHRLRRVLDVHADTMKLEDEVCRIWRTSTAEDSSREFVRRRALRKIEEQTRAMVVESDSYELPFGGSQSTSSVPPRRKQADVQLNAMKDSQRCEAAIFNYQEAVETILRALADLARTIDVGGQLDDMRLMMEFDAIGRRSSSGSDGAGRSGVPALVNIGAIQTLLASLPPKYNAEIVLAQTGRYDDYDTRS